MNRMNQLLRNYLQAKLSILLNVNNATKRVKKLKNIILLVSQSHLMMKSI